MRTANVLYSNVFCYAIMKKDRMHTFLFISVDLSLIEIN